VKGSIEFLIKSSMSHVETAASIIKEIIYMNISTVCEDGSPWGSPVYCAYDNELNFYWTSSPNNIRSKNLKNDNRTFVTIYDSTVPEGTGEGVYFQGVAEALDDPEEIINAREYTQARKGKSAEGNANMIFSGDSERKIYRFTPTKAWLNDIKTDDKGDYVHDIRVDLNLDELKTLVCKT